MDNLVKTDNPNYYKDEETGALVSTDLVKFNKFKRQQEQALDVKNQKNDLNNIKSEVADLKSEIGEIKDLLQQLLKQ